MSTAIRLDQAAAVAIVNEHGLQDVTDQSARWLAYSVGRFAAHCPAELVDQVTPADVAAWVEAERGGGAKAVTINNYLRGLRIVYSRLQRRGLVEGNPAAALAYLKQPARRPRAISRADYQAMRAAAECARDRAIFDVLWGSGCRLGGLVSMRVDRMEQWTGNDGRPCFAFHVVEKGGGGRLVYVGRERGESDGLAEWLAERPAVDDPALFLTRRRPWRALGASSVEGVIRRARIAAGIPAGRPGHAHAFRHAFALRMIDGGADLSAVSSWLGHGSAMFTAAVYANRTEAELRRKFFGDDSIGNAGRG